jgi:hypothetical protein
MECYFIGFIATLFPHRLIASWARPTSPSTRPGRGSASGSCTRWSSSRHCPHSTTTTTTTMRTAYMRGRKGRMERDLLFVCLHSFFLFFYLGYAIFRSNCIIFIFVFIACPPLTPRVTSFLSRCQSPTGGFGGGPGQLPHCAPTYAAISALMICGTEQAYRVIDR